MHIHYRALEYAIDHKIPVPHPLSRQHLRQGAFWQLQSYASSGACGTLAALYEHMDGKKIQPSKDLKETCTTSFNRPSHPHSPPPTHLHPPPRSSPHLPNLPNLPCCFWWSDLRLRMKEHTKVIFVVMATHTWGQSSDAWHSSRSEGTTPLSLIT